MWDDLDSCLHGTMIYMIMDMQPLLGLSSTLEQGLVNYYHKRPYNKSLSFVGHMVVSVTNNHFYPLKASIDNMYMMSMYQSYFI